MHDWLVTATERLSSWEQKKSEMSFRQETDGQHPTDQTRSSYGHSVGQSAIIDTADRNLSTGRTRRLPISLRPSVSASSLLPS